MDKLLAIAGGQPLRVEDWALIQDQEKTALAKIIESMIGDNTYCILTGLVRSHIDDHFVFSEGYVFANGEIYHVPEATLSDNKYNYFFVQEVITTSEDRLFHDASHHNVYELRSMEMAEDPDEVPEGAIDYRNLQTLKGILGNYILAQVPGGEDMIYLGACQGKKYPEIRRAVKMFSISWQFQMTFYYISKFINGSGSGAEKTYTIEISRSTLIADPGTVVVSATYVSSVKTGVEYFGLGQANNSGLLGAIVMDLDQLKPGQTYTCANWIEGGMFAVNTYKEVSPGGGGLADSLIEFTDDFAPDGSLPVYLFSGGAGKTATVVPIAEIQAEILIKNISGENLRIQSAEDLNIDGMAKIDLHTGGYIRVIANNLKFEAIGSDYAEYLP